MCDTDWCEFKISGKKGARGGHNNPNHIYYKPHTNLMAFTD